MGCALGPLNTAGLRADVRRPRQRLEPGRRLAGYPSLGHAAFFGIGAYAVALIFNDRACYRGTSRSWLPVIGVAVAALIGVPIGWISMRTRADVFAIVTITLLFVAQTLAFNLRGLTGGAQGLALARSRRSRVDHFELAVLLRHGRAAGRCRWACSLYFALRSKIGLSLAAVRADEDKARGLGVRGHRGEGARVRGQRRPYRDARRVWAYYVSFIYPQFAVDPLITIAVVLMTFLGGRGTLWGPVLGAFMLEPAQQYLAYSARAPASST